MKHTSNDKSNEISLKEKSNDKSNESSEKRRGNGLTTDERDYMIDKACRDLGIIGRFRPAVAKAANYIDGPRFWEIFGSAERAKYPAHYFIKAINREMYR